MSLTVKEIIKYMQMLAPEELKENWDNVGLMVGCEDSIVKKVLFALDVNDEVVDEAINNDCSLIITHHPLIFGSLKNITNSSPLGRRIIKLIKNDISVFSAHTNFDICLRGTNSFLANLFELKNIENLCPPVCDNVGLGKVGFLQKEMPFIDFAKFVKEKLNLKNVTISGNAQKTIKKIGLCTGSGADKELMNFAIKAKCDAYVTGDIKFHDAQFANDLGLCLVDATHYGTEACAMKTMAEYLEKIKEEKNLDFECILSQIDGQTLKII